MFFKCVIYSIYTRTGINTFYHSTFLYTRLKKTYRAEVSRKRQNVYKPTYTGKLYYDMVQYAHCTMHTHLMIITTMNIIIYYNDIIIRFLRAQIIIKTASGKVFCEIMIKSVTKFLRDTNFVSYNYKLNYSTIIIIIIVINNNIITMGAV